MGTVSAQASTGILPRELCTLTVCQRVAIVPGGGGGGGGGELG